MTDFYDEELFKGVKDFEKMLDGDWYDELTKIKDPDIHSSTMKWKIRDLQYAVKMMYIIMQAEMSQTNKIKNIISKLPDHEEFKELKQEVETQKINSIETLLPIKKLADDLQESKNKKVDYVG